MNSVNFSIENVSPFGHKVENNEDITNCLILWALSTENNKVTFLYAFPIETIKEKEKLFDYVFHNERFSVYVVYVDEFISYKVVGPEEQKLEDIYEGNKSLLFYETYTNDIVCGALIIKRKKIC